MRASDVRELLRGQIEAAGSAWKWARERGVHPTMVSLTLTGGRDPGPAVLAALGIERTTVYRRATPGEQPETVQIDLPAAAIRALDEIAGARHATRADVVAEAIGVLLAA